MHLNKKIGEGQEAEVYTCGMNTVFKLFRNESYEEKAHTEFELMKTVHAQGLPSPAVYECTTVNGRPGYSMEYIEGRSLLSLLLDAGQSARKTAVQFASIQALIHAAPVLQGIKPEKGSLEWCIMHAGLSGKEQRHTRKAFPCRTACSGTVQKKSGRNVPEGVQAYTYFFR